MTVLTHAIPNAYWTKVLLFVASFGLTGLPIVSAQVASKTIRVATYNASLHRKQAGDLVKDLSGQDNAQAKAIAEIIQKVRPDVLLLNEIDYQADGAPPRLLRDNYFKVSQNGLAPIDYPYLYAPSSNTGAPSKMDLDKDGSTDGPGDCYGFGRYPGQYAFAVFSRYPIGRPRSFQKFLWRDMPDARVPQAPGSDATYYSTDVWSQLRLSSKNHCDVPIQLPGGDLHFLVCHPTPPVFDKEEDRNGARNADEIRFWRDYITPDSSQYIYDDQGARGGLAPNSRFVIAGDLNSDPADGDSRHEAIRRLLAHPLAQDTKPTSHGAPEDATSKRNREHKGDPATDTAQWSSGNYRVDYVIPSRNMQTTTSGVFWPVQSNADRGLIKASDHRLVWIEASL